MELEQIMDAMQKISAWRPLRRLLKEKSLPSGQSWLDIRNALAGADRATVGLLIDLYEELKLYGRKHIYLFKVSEEMRNFFLSKNITPNPTSEFLGKYPFPTDKDGFVGPRLTKIIDNANERCFVFCSHRRTDAQFSLDLKYLREDVPENIRSSRIKVFQRQREQAFDVVAVPKSESAYIQIRIDNFECATEPKHTEALYAIKLAMNHLFDDKFSSAVRPVNIQPLMNAIYSDPNEGKITELEFMSPSGSYKKESLRMKTDEDDLRVEAYHLAGKTAVGTIGIFRLGVAWYRDGNDKNLSNASLLLPGTIRTLEDPILYEARISSMTTAAEYQWMLGRLTSLMKQVSSQGQPA